MAGCVKKAKKIAAYQTGVGAEAQAAAILKERGFDIISRRFRSAAGEIDLVASNGAHLSFVEVKARRTLDDAAWSVTPRQQRRIAEAASIWLQTFPQYGDQDMSFDAVLVAPCQQSTYIADAFRV